MVDVTAERFRAVFGRLATGVMVLTTRDDGAPHGMTVNAVSSVSMDPFLVLVCVERGTVMEAMLERSGRFALSTLAADAEKLSVHFADPDRPPGEAQFEGIATHDETTGCPVLDDAIAWVDCEVWAIYDGGDHVIVVGEVSALDVGVEAPPLVYYRSGYHGLDERPADAG